MSRLKLEVVTPEQHLLSEEVDEVIAPGVMGQFDVLPGHTTLLAELTEGTLTYISKGVSKSISIFGGFAEVREDRVTILADSIKKVSETPEVPTQPH